MATKNKKREIFAFDGKTGEEYTAEEFFKKYPLKEATDTEMSSLARWKKNHPLRPDFDPNTINWKKILDKIGG
jgi:hypothetical protein